MRVTRRLFRTAFIHSLPVLMGYVAMGLAAGILLAKTVVMPHLAGWAFLTSAVNISGALQFLLVEWTAHPLPLTGVVVLTLCLNLRYAMYGFSLLERFRPLGFGLKSYLIWTLTDETYAIEVANRVPEGEDSTAYCLLVAALDHLYWVVGVVAGALIGGELPFDSKGIDFAMTALFLVILTDQCRERINRWPSLIGLGAALVCRCVLGLPTAKMLLPTIPLMLLLLLIFRKRLLAFGTVPDGEVLP
ncbi:MAG: AzlC family ABC transporter permease [Kiritimatiellae bacterium]|nr:AzlC family ABC transporter permease [Kiritimatiellia bacterium]